MNDNKVWHELRFERFTRCQLTTEQIKEILHQGLLDANLIGVVFDDELNTYDWTETRDLSDVLCKISTKLPDVIVDVTSTSETDTNNVWRNYYKEGRYHYAASRRTFEPFDPFKLKHLIERDNTNTGLINHELYWITPDDGFTESRGIIGTEIDTISYADGTFAKIGDIVKLFHNGEHDLTAPIIEIPGLTAGVWGAPTLKFQNGKCLDRCTNWYVIKIIDASDMLETYSFKYKDLGYLQVREIQP